MPTFPSNNFHINLVSIINDAMIDLYMYDLLSLVRCDPEAENFSSVHPVHVMYTIEHFTFGMGILDADFFSCLLPGHCTHNILLA